MNGKSKFYTSLILFQFLLILTVFFSVNGIIKFAAAQTSTAPENLAYYQAITGGLLGIGAGLAVGMAVLGSGIAIKTVGTSAIAALTEREESFFKAFIVVALCEALAVYGLIIAILLWTKIPSPPA
ncbi:MAG: ATP synthase subunit C [Promethearchaeota archaeon]